MVFDTVAGRDLLLVFVKAGPAVTAAQLASSL